VEIDQAVRVAREPRVARGEPSVLMHERAVVREPREENDARSRGALGANAITLEVGGIESFANPRTRREPSWFTDVGPEQIGATTKLLATCAPLGQMGASGANFRGRRSAISRLVFRNRAGDRLGVWFGGWR
jgi:hypothetical protein